MVMNESWVRAPATSSIWNTYWYEIKNLIIHKQTKRGSKWDWKQTKLTKFWALHIKNHHRMQQKSFSFWYIIWFLLNTRRFWWIFASKSKFRTMLVNSLLNLPNLLSNSDPLRFLFGDYCSKSGLNLAKMGLVLCHFNLLRF